MAATSPPTKQNSHAPSDAEPNPDVSWQGEGPEPVVVEDTSWRPEVKTIIRMAVPTIVQGAAQQAMLVTDQLFVGHLGTNALAAAALGTTYSNLMWFFLLGSSTALDTLGAQAFGARNRTALLRVTLTSMVVQSVLCAVLTVALCFGREVALHVFGQDDEVADLVAEYCYGLIPGMWPLVLGLSLMKYLQTQNIMMVPALITVAAFLLNIGFNAAFISWLNFKFVLLVIAIYRHEKQKQREQHKATLVSNQVAASDPELNSVPLLAPHDGSATGAPDEPHQPTGTSTPEVQARDPEEHAHTSETSRMLELAPWHGRRTLDEQCSSSGPGADRPNGSKSKRLVKSLSWFRSPSWRADGTQSSSSDSGGPSVNGASGETDQQASSPSRYWVSQLKASVHRELLTRYLKLALPGGFMLAFEAAAFDVTTAMAGHLGSVVTAAHAALLGVVFFTYAALPFAVSTAATIRVGNLLGAGQPLLARKSGYLSICMTAGCMTLFAIIILSCRNVLGRAFSSDPEVIATMATIAPYAALFQVSDGVMGPSQGILRGCGRQLQIMCTNVLGFWALGVFLGYMLTFRAGLGVYGLWIGITSGDFAAASLNMLSVAFINWKKEALNAAVGVQSLQQPGDTPAAAGQELVQSGRTEASHRRRKADLHPSVINQC